MEEEEGGIRLSKRFGDNKGNGEVDFKTKAGTAWSHSYLNQKPWHPLSYPNQRRKWIAEQTLAQKERRAEEVAREYAQEQEFFRQAALVSKKEKEKMEMMKAVSFMYVRPPGYNAESAKAAEFADEQKKEQQGENNPSVGGASISNKLESVPHGDEKKKPRAKDVFGRPLPTEEQFEVLKNAPRLETGVLGRAKPFGVEIRNVKCVRCGNFGHQSGDRECPLKDVIMPNEENRLKRDDPLTAILAQTDSSEPLKWELKQKPGLSPPRGGFDPDDPNQQIVAEEIFDEYGGFLSGEVPDLLANMSSSKPKKKSSGKSKHKRRLSPITAELGDRQESGSASEDERSKRSKKRHKRETIKRESKIKSDYHRHQKRSSRRRHSSSRSSDDSDSDEQHRHKHRSHRKYVHLRSSLFDHSDSDEQHRCKHHSHHKHKQSHSRGSDQSDFDKRHEGKHRSRHKHKQSRSGGCHHSDSDKRHNGKHRSHRKRMQSRSSSSGHSDSDIQYRSEHQRHHHHRHCHNQSDSSSK